MKKIRVISLTRTSEIIVSPVSIDQVKSLHPVHVWKEKDQKKSTITLERISAWLFLTMEQYLNLYWELPYLTDSLSFAKITGNKLIEDKLIIFPKWRKISPFKVIHTYLNNNNVIACMERFWAETILFDQSINMPIVIDKIENRILRPDWAILNDHLYCFIETDLATEPSWVLFKKARNYKDYFQQIIQEWNIDYAQIRVCFFTTSQIRLDEIRKRRIFRALEILGVIEYLLINEK
jgi:hypothetical protein